MDIWWVTPEKRSRSSIASFFMFSFHNRAIPRLVLLLVSLVRGNGFTALLGQKQWCFNLQKSNVCLVLAFVCYIFFANSTNTECNYICTCIFVIIWHMIWQCHINWAFLRASQTASAMCCYLPWRMTRRTALITPPPPPDHGKSPGWHMTRAWFGKKTAVVWPWGKELKIYLHKELKAMYRHLKAISWFLFWPMGNGIPLKNNWITRLELLPEESEFG